MNNIKRVMSISFSQKLLIKKDGRKREMKIRRKSILEKEKRLGAHYRKNIIENETYYLSAP